MTNSLRSQIRTALAGAVYRKFRCTGSQCGFEEIFLDGWQPVCPTSGCRGTMTPRRVVPLKQVIDQTMRWIEHRQSTSNSAFQAGFHGVSGSLRAQESGNERLPEAPKSKAAKAEIESHAMSLWGRE